MEGDVLFVRRAQAWHGLAENIALWLIRGGIFVNPSTGLAPKRPALTYCTNNGAGRYFSPKLLCRYSRMCRRVSKPTKSTSSNGPMGWFKPKL